MGSECGVYLCGQNGIDSAWKGDSLATMVVIEPVWRWRPRCGPGYPSTATILETTLTAGVYTVVVEGYQSAEGDYSLQIFCSTLTTQPPAGNPYQGCVTSPQGDLILVL